MNSSEKTIRARLLGMRDEEYGAFTRKLIPTVSADRIIGIRTPALRAYAAELRGTDDAVAFLDALPHMYYEENNLHGFLIEGLKSYEEVVERLDKFLPFVDNWATCDSMRPKAFGKRLSELSASIDRWTASGDTYTVRFGIEMLMTFYLDGEFSPDRLETVAAIRSEEYYVNMMIAWFFATALAKQYEETLPYIQQKRLEKWTHNKAIQKAVESRRISDEQKNELRKLKMT